MNPFQYIFPLSNSDRARSVRDRIAWFMRVISIGHDKWWVHGNNDQEPFRNVSRKIDFDVSNAHNNNLLEIYFSWSVKHYFLLWIEEGIFEIFDI